MENSLFDYLVRYMASTVDEKNVVIVLDIFKKYTMGTVLLKEGRINILPLKGRLSNYRIRSGFTRPWYRVNKYRIPKNARTL